MDNYIDPKKFPEWYSAQYTQQDKEIIKLICKKTFNEKILNNILLSTST
jgi:hypothetical protein